MIIMCRTTVIKLPLIKKLEVVHMTLSIKVLATNPSILMDIRICSLLRQDPVLINKIINIYQHKILLEKYFLIKVTALFQILFQIPLSKAVKSILQDAILLNAMII